MRFRLLSLAVLVPLLVTACGGSEDTPGQVADGPSSSQGGATPTDDPAAGEDGPEVEGSVTTADGSFVQYPDGVVVRFKSVERLPFKLSSRAIDDPVPTDLALIKVTVTVENGGSAPMPFDSDLVPLVLYYGENRFKSDNDPGYFSASGPSSDEILTSEQPQQVVPGSSHDVFSSFTLPATELGSLAVLAQIRPEVYTTWTFTDVQSKL